MVKNRKQKLSFKKGLCALGISVLIGVLIFSERQGASADALQRGIASKILRFHVIANSDREEDQALKLEIKNAIVEYMGEVLRDADNIEETRTIINEQIPAIKAIAQTQIEARGYSYPVEVFLDHRYFPIKTYGSYTFPAGKYEALCVELGNHSGKNWWCVMYPSLCFVDAVHATVPEKSDVKLQQILTDEEYSAIADGRAKVKFSLKFLEWFR